MNNFIMWSVRTLRYLFIEEVNLKKKKKRQKIHNFIASRPSICFLIEIIGGDVARHHDIRSTSDAFPHAISDTLISI